MKRTYFLFAFAVSLAGCGNYNDAKLAMKQEALRQECFGELTNTCTSKSVDFDIAVLESIDTPGWSPFPDARTKQGMVDAFGENGWALFEESVDQVRKLWIQRLESKRPSWLSRTFRGDEQPSNGGVRAFVGPEDILPIKEQIQQVFAEKLRASGWSPSPEALARHAPKSTRSSSSSQSGGSQATSTGLPAASEPAAVKTLPDGTTVYADGTTFNPDDLETDPEEAAGEGSSSPAPSPAANIDYATQWASVKADPDAFLRQCIQTKLSKGPPSGMPNFNAQDAAAWCQSLLVGYQNCMANPGTDVTLCLAEQP